MGRRWGAARGGPIVNLNPIRKTINAACAVPSQMPDEPYQPQQTEEFQENEARARAATVKILDRSAALQAQEDLSQFLFNFRAPAWDATPDPFTREEKFESSKKITTSLGSSSVLISVSSNPNTRSWRSARDQGRGRGDGQHSRERSHL